jgi:hypothetical protein
MSPTLRDCSGGVRRRNVPGMALRLPSLKFPRGAAWAGVCLLTACESTLALGGECLPFGESCRDPGDSALSARDAGSDSALSGDGDSDARVSPPLDGALADGPDAQPALEAGTGDGGGGNSGGPPGVLPGLENRSFDLKNGSDPGDFGGTAPLSNTDISPWYQCQVPGASFLRVEEQVGTATPREGQTFMAFGFPYVADLPVLLYQEPLTPLRAGQPYAFLVDVRAEGGDQVIALGVRGGNVRCEALTKLTDTDYLPDGQWVERCVRFTPDNTLTQFALVPVVKGVIASSFRLFIDNIRSDPSCR